MFGFVNYNKEKRGLGGDVFRKRQQRLKILLTILGLLGFAILNLILYLLIQV